jgi:hypothetical protein
MRCIALINYDPATAATASTATLLAMTAIDTTNLRHTFTVPASGKVRVVLECTIHGGSAHPQILIGVLQSSTVICRVPPRYNTFSATSTALNRARAEFTITGLTPGASLTWDAAYSVETIVAATAIKWGGPNNATANDAFGAFSFELWDADPYPANFSAQSIDSNGRVDTIKIAGTTQTARDIGESVLVSAGTGAGQLDFTSGRLNVNTTHAAGTAWNSGALTGATIGSGYVSAITNGLATSSEVLPMAMEVSSIFTDTGTSIPATLVTIAGYLDTEIADIKAVTNKLDTTIELDGSVYRYTTNALEQAPSGGGGGTDWTTDEKAAIRSILGIPASGTTPDDPTVGILDTIRDAVGAVDGVVDAILVDTAEIGAAGAGLTSLPWNTAWDAEVQSECADALAAYGASTYGGADTSGITTLLDRLTSARASYFDKLNITGSVASSGEVTAIQNNTRIAFIVPEQVIRPASGTTTVYVRVYLYDATGNMEAPDSAPTIELRNAVGADLTARLASPTGTLESTGVYRWAYTSSAADNLEQILWSLTIVEGGATRSNGRASWIADTYTTDFTSSDRTTLNAIAGFVDSMPADVRTELAAELARIDVATSTRLATAGYTTPPTVGQIDTQLSSAHGAGSWATAVGFAVAGDEMAITTSSANALVSATAGAAATAITIDHGSGSYVRNTEPPTVGQIDTQLSGTHGAGQWITAVGFSTHSASDVWLSGTRTLSAFGFAVDTNANATEVAIKAKTDNLPASPAAVGSAMTLTSGERDAAATALLDLTNGVEASITVRGALRAIASALAGVLSGAGGSGNATVTVRAVGNAGTTRLTVETDEDGNRTSVTLG